MIFIAFGSNIPGPEGDSIDTLRTAVNLLAKHGVVVEAASGLYETPAIGPGRQKNYVNAVAAVSSQHGPAALLTNLARIEIRCGRWRGLRWTARALDLDLLAYGQMVTGWRGDIAALRTRNQAASRLVIPHPRMDFRPFVLRPFIDIAPHWRHPVSGKQAIELWNTVRRKRDAIKIIKIAGPEWIG